MRGVYQQAEKVVISLGGPSKDSAKAIDFVEILERGLGNLYHRGASISEEALIEELGYRWPGPSWTALNELFRRHWFSRVWVVQEVAVGEEEPMFILGDRAVAWKTVTFVAVRPFKGGLVRLLEHDHNYPRRRQTSPEGLRFLAEMDEACWNKHGSGSGEFQEIMMGFHHFSATNHRNKVYALLGLASDTNDKALAPKYSLDVEEVYFNTARYLLLRDKY